MQADEYRGQVRKAANQRAIAAYRLRQQGMTYREIGEHFNVSKTRADQLVSKGYRLTWRERVEIKA
jgi:orotate phosphoribosyltransferase-like protein